MTTAHNIPKIDARLRSKTGSREASRARGLGRLPAVVYGHHQQPDHVDVDRTTLLNLVRDHVHVIELNYEGKHEPCLIKELQWDHLGAQVIHVDLARVDLNERVKVEVELLFVGDAIGLKTSGAYLEHPLTSVEIECLVTQIPDAIRVDVSKLGVGDLLTAKDLVLPAGATCLESPDAVVAAVHIKVEEEAAPAAEGAAEPELIRKEKTEEAEA